MPREQSAGAVIFRMVNTEPRYLLLHYPSSSKAKEDYWDLPKGHMEEGESEQETVRREVKEETGLEDINLVDRFREVIQYYFKVQRKTVFKTVVFYLGQTNQEHIKISAEHIGYQWLPFAEAQTQVKFSNAKHVLLKAHLFISSRSKREITSR